jgi:ABC-type Fe3+ transport system permease subunit
MIEYRGLPSRNYIQGDTSRVLFVSLFVCFFVCWFLCLFVSLFVRFFVRRKTGDVATTLSHLRHPTAHWVAYTDPYCFFWCDPF